MVRFSDRVDAGRQLSRRLTVWSGTDAIVLGLPRGGVVVAFEVATTLQLPLDVLVVRKLGVPSQPELAMGALGEDGVVVSDDEVLSMIDIDDDEWASVARKERTELDRRVARYRIGHPPMALEGRRVLIVDDGVATGSTARAACQVARARGATNVVLAVPVVAQQSVSLFSGVADELVSIVVAEDSFSVGQWYVDFRATTDEEVVNCLDQCRAR